MRINTFGACETLIDNLRKFDYRRKEALAKDQEGDTQARERLSDLFVREGLEVRFHPPGNYKLQFIADTSEVIIRAGAPRRGIQARFLHGVYFVLLF